MRSRIMIFGKTETKYHVPLTDPFSLAFFEKIPISEIEAMKKVAYLTFLGQLYQYSVRYPQLGPEPKVVNFDDNASATEEANLSDLLTLVGLPVSSFIHPERDKREIMARLNYANGQPLQVSHPDIQRAGSELVRSVAMGIERTFDTHLSPVHKAQLQAIPQGVTVVKRMRDLIADPTTFADMSPATAQDVNVHWDIHGLVVSPFNALFLDEDFITDPHISDDEKKHTAAHETHHVLGQNNLPMLLDEAATDDFAQASTGFDVGSQYRMGKNFRIACHAWQHIKQRAGDNLAWQGYTEPACIRQTCDIRTQRVIASQFVGHPFHDHMRAELGTSIWRVNRWDRVLELTDQKRMVEADAILHKRHVTPITWARGLGYLE